MPRLLHVEQDNLLMGIFKCSVATLKANRQLCSTSFTDNFSLFQLLRTKYFETILFWNLEIQRSHYIQPKVYKFEKTIQGRKLYE